MAASAGSFRRRRRRWPWSELPSELLGLVLSRLPSHADRVRLPAVCRPWRSSVRLQQPLPLPPLLPWLALCRGTFLSLPDGAVHRLPVADEDVSFRISTGSTLFLVHDDGRCSMVNPCFPATTTPLPELAAWIASKKKRKPVVRKVVAFILDIALFQGKLYVQTSTNIMERNVQFVLYVLDAGREQTTVKHAQCMRDALRYLFYFKGPATAGFPYISRQKDL
ncbi:uncharacterized protein LOC112270690 [Brachypodium distachyon]|uniref:uncharacterized protein LOC112270690 n=1 Tax=Brachypodium distachyon TaxID=15368 RepID=UPI000D0CBA8D|nr:uncharacterized protein LOC112270690 [Brachypodium distachyon]|eukprot:XP_024314483.1 uncharacterized protein LOC112270690 [Brachypodium distachyon]